MINLLPRQEKQKLLHERWVRLGIILCWSVLVLEVFGMVFFVPAYYTLYLNTRDLARNLAQLRALTPNGAKGTQQDLALAKKEIAVLKVSSSIVNVQPSALLQEVILQKPEGIDFSSFAYVRTADTASIQLSGTALTQEDLLAFRRNVKVNPRVIDFKYGSSFITQKTDISFTTTITFQ